MMRIDRRRLLALHAGLWSMVGTLVLPGAAQAAPANGVQGHWLTEDRKAVIEISQCGPVLCGKVRRILDPAAPRHDTKNPEPSLRNRPMLGMEVLSGFKPAGSEWKGQIYDPKGGKSYKSIIRTGADGTLEVRGCILFLCQKQIWTRPR